jgi:hypothetical protein
VLPDSLAGEPASTSPAHALAGMKSLSTNQFAKTAKPAVRSHQQYQLIKISFAAIFVQLRGLTGQNRKYEHYRGA